MSTVSEIKPFPHDFWLLMNTEIVNNKYFRNYKRVRSACSISLHKRIMYPPCDMSPLCFANPETFGAQRCYLLYVTFVQSLFAKSWTKLDMSLKYVCPFSTKTAENNVKIFVHRKGLVNSSVLASKSPNDQKLNMSPLCSKQSMCAIGYNTLCIMFANDWVTRITTRIGLLN